MHQSKLFSLLHTFVKADWKSFRGYLVWQTREGAEVVTIYDYILQSKDALDHERLKVDTVCGKLFKTKTRKNFLNLLSKLTSYVLNYLATQELHYDQRALQLHTTLALNTRGLYNEALKSRSQLRKIIDKSPLDIWNAYYNLRASHAIQFSDNPIKKTARKETYTQTFDTFQQLVAELRLYYLIDAEHIMRISREDLSSQIALLRSLTFDHDSPNTQILSLLLDLVREDSIASFEQLHTLLLTSSQEMDISIGTLTVLHMIQLQIREFKKGKGDIERLHLLYEYGVQHELLFDNGKIADGRFTQWIEVVCLTDQPARGYQVIEDWSHTIHEDSRAEVVSLSLGYCHFYNRRYDDSIKELSTFPYRQRLIKNVSREMLLMNYLLLYPEEVDFLLTQINNYREYRRRHWQESSKFHNNGADNFVKILLRIVRGEPCDSILHSVNKEQYLIRRTWLRTYLKAKGAK